MGLSNLRTSTGGAKKKHHTIQRRNNSSATDHPKNYKKEQKFQKKLQFYSKVKDTVSSLGVKKAINKKKRVRSQQKKLKAFDFSSLLELLPDLDVPSKLPNSTKLKINCKNKNKLVEMESKQFKAVTNNPMFQVDPFSAIHHHLQGTQPTVTSQVKKNRTGKKTKSRRKKGGLSSGTQSMDM